MTKFRGSKRDMVWIPPGPFLYGDSKESRELAGFWIDRIPVTNAAYQRFVDANREYPVPFETHDWARPYNWDQGRRTYPTGRGQHPVTLVAWYDAQAYAEWAGGRLPTELEWEKAARGTDGRKYPWGDWDHDRCNTAESELMTTTPVGAYSPRGDSPFGCTDMAGNVWEWAIAASGNRWVVRGGSLAGDRLQARCAHRDWDLPDSGIRLCGFRLVAVAGIATRDRGEQASDP